MIPTLDNLWHLTLADLRGQTAVVTFNTWLAGSQVVDAACTATFWVIAVPNGYACDWLSHRFYPTAVRTAVSTSVKNVLISSG